MRETETRENNERQGGVEMKFRRCQWVIEGEQERDDDSQSQNSHRGEVLGDKHEESQLDDEDKDDGSQR